MIIEKEGAGWRIVIAQLQFLVAIDLFGKISQHAPAAASFLLAKILLLSQALSRDNMILREFLSKTSVKLAVSSQRVDQLPTERSRPSAACQVMGIFGRKFDALWFFLN